MGRGAPWTKEEVNALAAIVNRYIGPLNGRSVHFFVRLFRLGRIPHILTGEPNPRTPIAMHRYLTEHRYNAYYLLSEFGPTLILYTSTLSFECLTIHYCRFEVKVAGRALRRQARDRRARWVMENEIRAFPNQADDEEESEGDENEEDEEEEETDESDETDDHIEEDDDQQRERMTLRHVKPVNYCDVSSDLEDTSGTDESDNHDADDEEEGDEQSHSGDISKVEDDQDVEADVEDVQDGEVFNEIEVIDSTSVFRYNDCFRLPQV